MNMKIFYAVMLVLCSFPLNAESIQNEYLQKVASSVGLAVVDAKIGSSCVKQISPTTGQTNIANQQECRDALDKLESGLGTTDEEAVTKLKISEFKRQYNLL